MRSDFFRSLAVAPDENPTRYKCPAMFVATGDKTEAPRLPWVPLSIADISSLDAGTRAKALKEMLDAAETAATLEVHYLVVHPGLESAIIPPREETLQRMENVVDALNQVSQRCHALGIS